MGALMAWLAAVGLQTARDVKTYHRAPLPSEFVVSGGWFGALALLDGIASPVGSIIAWGTLAALAFAVQSPGGGGTGHPLGDFISNGYPDPLGRFIEPGAVTQSADTGGAKVGFTGAAGKQGGGDAKRK